MIVTTAAEMRRMDALAIERFGIPSETLMERAGSGAAEILLERFPHVRKHGVVVLAGKGNNGGDGFVVARCLKRRRVRAEVFLAVPAREIRGPALAKLQAWRRAGGKVHQLAAGNLAPLARALARAGCIVDALFGTGITGEVTGFPAELIALVNASGVPTVALDLPSGLDADRGVPLGIAIEAELTIAFAAPKIGTVLYPGARFVGDLAVVDIGIPEEAVREVGPTTEVVAAADAAALLRPRDVEAHKGTHGHLAVVAGARGKTGAAILAARAAARAGAGLVTVGCPDGVLPMVAAGLLEAMTWPLPDDGTGALAFGDTSAPAYRKLLDDKSAAVVGPGIGTSAEREALVRWLVTARSLPTLLDADALNCLAAVGPPAARPSGGHALVLTPHPGEMARLAGTSTEEIQADRLAAARRAAAAFDAIVVLKGARTVTATPDGHAWINLSGNPGLAAGGTGDVLAGIIGSLLAQRYPAADAAVLGVFLHGFAADRVAARQGMVGLLASDLIEELPVRDHGTRPRGRAVSPRAHSFASASVEETEALGRRLGGLAAAGDVFGLRGDLGAGKTAFVRGLASGLAVPEHLVASPTFTMIAEYGGGRLPLFHIDLYRLEPRDVDLLALAEYLHGPGVAAIEWFDRLPPDALDAYLGVQIEYAAPGRRLVLEGLGPRASALIAALDPAP